MPWTTTSQRRHTRQCGGAVHAHGAAALPVETAAFTTGALVPLNGSAVAHGAGVAGQRPQGALGPALGTTAATIGPACGTSGAPRMPLSSTLDLVRHHRPGRFQRT